MYEVLGYRQCFMSLPFPPLFNYKWKALHKAKHTRCSLPHLGIAYFRAPRNAKALVVRVWPHALPSP